MIHPPTTEEEQQKKNPQQHPAAPRGGICKQVNVTENTASASGGQSQSGSAPKCLKLLFIEVAANHVCIGCSYEECHNLIPVLHNSKLPLHVLVQAANSDGKKT